MCGCFIHCHAAIFLHDGFNCFIGLWCHYLVAWPGRSESVTEVMPFMNLVHLYTCCSDRDASPYWTFIHRLILIGFTPSLCCSFLVHVVSVAAVFTLLCHRIAFLHCTATCRQLFRPWVTLLPTYRKFKQCFKFLSHFWGFHLNLPCTYYSHVPHNDVLVNEGPHVRWW
jgi:hypothetical protein